MIKLLCFLLFPGLLTDKLEALGVDRLHWLAHKLGIYEGMHDWLHGMCPCGN